jgi:uncharacterized RDD family membrane protein YckC
MKLNRIIAYIIDVIIIGVLSGILCAIFGISAITLWAESGVSIIYNPVTWVGLGLSVLYFFTDVWMGGTIGKKLVGLSVIQTNPESAKASAAFIRAFLKVISINLLFGVILFLIGEEDRSFHDNIAGTRVSKRASEPSMAS